MLYVYIGAAAVVGLLIGFVLLCVLWISPKVGSSIRAKTIDLISAYDELLEEGSRKLMEITTKSKQYQETSEKNESTESAAEACTGAHRAILNAAERIGTASYRSQGIGDAYLKIKGAFRRDAAEVLADLQKVSGERKEGPATRLLSELSYDSVYWLSVMPEEEQKALLAECLQDDERGILDEYLDTYKKFSAIAFYDYLQAVAAMEPQPPRLWVSPLYDGVCPDDVEVIVDPDICEGFRIEFDNTLYDYCITRRELI